MGGVGPVLIGFVVFVVALLLALFQSGRGVNPPPKPRRPKPRPDAARDAPPDLLLDTELDP